MNQQRVYRARARQWGLGESSKGKEQVAISFDITTEGAEFNSINAYLYFTEKTWERTVESLRHMGWTGSDIADLAGLDANEVELVIKDDTYDGETRPKVKWINRIGGLELKAPLTGDKLKAFSAVLQMRIQGMGPSTAPQKAKPLPPPKALDYGPPPLTDDDIPF